MNEPARVRALSLRSLKGGDLPWDILRRLPARRGGAHEKRTKSGLPRRRLDISGRVSEAQRFSQAETVALEAFDRKSKDAARRERLPAGPDDRPKVAKIAERVRSQDAVVGARRSAFKEGGRLRDLKLVI